MANETQTKTIKVTLVKGMIGVKKEHRATAFALGLRKRNHTVEQVDTPVIRGMINAIRFMVEVSE